MARSSKRDPTRSEWNYRFGQFWGQKDRLHAENGGFRNGTQQDLNKMVDMVKFWGAKRSSRCRKWGAKPRPIPTDSQRGSAITRYVGASDSFYWHGLTLILVWISNHIPRKVWDEIAYPFPNFNSYTIEVWEWISNFIPHFIMDVITYPCWD